MRAIILIGHGSLRSASGASMIRIAARLREQGVAAMVEASFLNFSRPTLAEAIEKCARQGARQIVVQPYFLIAGAYVLHDVPRLLREVAVHHPEVDFALAGAFGDHPALVELALKRVQEAEARISDSMAFVRQRGLLLMAHGTPLEEANAPLYSIAAQVAKAGDFAHHAVSYMELNQPDIVTAAEQLVAAGAERIVALPYFLQLGRHVREDLPAAVDAVQARHRQTQVVRAQHLDYDLLLAQAIADRVRAAVPFLQPVA